MIYDEKETALLSPGEVEFLRRIIKSRDEINKGMERREVITLIMELKQTADRKKCENHYDFLIRKKRLPLLKRLGRVSTAQPTTTKRSQITVEQQLRWHTTVDSILAELDRVNQPAVEYQQLKAHFFGNLDECCLRADDGKVTIVASAAKQKTERIMADSRATITSVRVGMASGKQGPFIFLAKGQSIERNSLKHIDKKKGVPPFSRVVMTPNAYVNDDVWLSIAPNIAKGIRAMPVIKDHPSWWVVLSLDGFGAHCNVQLALQIFSDHKIWIIKEEGDTSQVNQAYDQAVAKADKDLMRAALALLRPQLGMAIDQWYLITVALQAQLSIKEEHWVSSFIKVNLHPDHRVPFDAWLRVLDRRGILTESSERYFEERESFYDAMPAVWKKLTPGIRQSIMETIDTIYNCVGQREGERVWTKANVLELSKFVELDDVYKLRACYFTAKKDPSVITRTREEISTRPVPEDEGNQAIDEYFSWRPKELMQLYLEDKDQNNGKRDLDLQMKVWNHITNFVAQQHWNNNTFE